MPPKYRYSLQVAQVSLTLETCFPLQVSQRFRPFLVKSNDRGYLAKLRETPSLPEPDGPMLWQSNSYEVFYNPEGGFDRWYYNELHNHVRFARLKQNIASRTIQLDFIPEEKSLLSTLSNCYSFIGWETILLHERRLILHAACVDTPLGGLLFSGRSGIGKSTQADLWCRYAGGELINGDRPILHKSEGNWYAYGSPYAGSSHCYRNARCPIRALFLLRQSPECSLRRLGKAQAFREVFAGITAASWDSTALTLACELTEQLVSEIPVFSYCCTPDRNAVEFVQAYLSKETVTWT